MRLAIHACLCALTCAIAACAPRWIRPEFREEMTARAIEMAIAEHACPREQVSMRCDVSSTTRLVHGRAVVFDDDGVIGTYVTETPSWEVELAVCGHLRRYRFEPPRPVSDADPWGERSSIVEVRRTCGGAYCLGAEPACKNCKRDQWWPVDTMPAASLCTNAVDDGSVTVEVVDQAIEIVLVVDAPRELPRRCGDSTLFVVVDGAWYSLCGDGSAHLRPGVHRIPTGITLGVNLLGGRSHVIEAYDARAGGCRRSLPVNAVLPRTTASWSDVLTVDRSHEHDTAP